MPTITDVSNLPAIFDAVFHIASNVPDIAWAATYEGLWPANAQIRTTPTLVVPYPEFTDFGSAGKPIGKVSAEGSKTLEMFWEIPVFCVTPYEESNSNTWRIPMDGLGYLVRDFRADRYLSNTCFNSKIVDPHLMEWIDKSNPALRFFGCMLTIRAYEQVLTPDS